MTYIVVDSQNSKISTIFEHREFLVKVLTRLSVLISESDMNAAKGEIDTGANSV